MKEETGLRTVFHHHCAGWVETPDEIARLLDLTDPALVGLVFDTGHYVYGAGSSSGDVLSGLNRFGDRIWYVHFKDCHPEVAAARRANGWDYFEALRHGVFCSEILADRWVDAVLICSSTHTHARLIVEAARAGKHIFCEKPIDHSLERIDEALDAVAQAGVKPQIGFNRRFDANFASVRAAVASGEIGQPHLLHIISRDPAPPPPSYVRTSGGMFLDMTIHDFDMVRFLIGDEVEEIYTAAGVMVDPAIGEAGDVDTAATTLRFRNGVIGTIDNSRKAVYGYDQRVEILGSAGAISTANCYPNQATISTAPCSTTLLRLCVAPTGAFLS